MPLDSAVAGIRSSATSTGLPIGLGCYTKNPLSVDQILQLSQDCYARRSPLRICFGTERSEIALVNVLHACW